MYLSKLRKFSADRGSRLPEHGFRVGGLNPKWADLKIRRTKVQHLLAYERVETDKKNLSKTVEYTNKLFELATKIPTSDNSMILQNGKKLPDLSLLPPMCITDNHKTPVDSLNFAPENLQFHYGNEYWGYEHVFESDRRFGKTSDIRDQSFNQYLRDMLDWWTEGPNQHALQKKIFETFLPRFYLMYPGDNSHKYCTFSLLDSRHLESRSVLDGLPIPRGSYQAAYGGRFNAGTLKDWHSNSGVETWVIDIKGNPWPKMPLNQVDENLKYNWENVFLEKHLKKENDLVNMNNKNGKNRKHYIRIKDRKDFVF